MKTSHSNPTQASATAGFTLMEVAIAIAVVVIGVLSLFALIGKGLDASNLAAEDTQTAIFADTVFNGLRSRSAVASEAGPHAWTTYWGRVMSGSTNIPLANANIWQGRVTAGPVFPIPRIFTTNAPAVFADGRSATQTLVNVPFHGTTITNIESVTLRYKMAVSLRYPIGHTNSLLDNRANVSLWVWGGPFGAYDLSDALYYYTAIENMGDL